MDGQRRRSCEAAIRCFRSQGVFATNPATICETAGLSVGAFYKHVGADPMPACAPSTLQPTISIGRKLQARVAPQGNFTLMAPDLPPRKSLASSRPAK
ncbi:MAG: TetR/AcrR family transcriptional regulator [Proteobacteria bacterium]|nr:TetR/AcrR family transcriptional regulator [Pseudomonadota bacterium]